MRTNTVSALRPLRTHLQRQSPFYRTTRFRSQYTDHSTGYIPHQRVVRTVKPLFSWRRFTISCLYGISTYCTLKYLPKLLGVSVEVELDDENTTEDSEVSVTLDADGEVSDDSFFIPMTWAQELPRRFYKGTDPEWQEFVKVSMDNPRQKAIMDELIGIVRSNVLKHPTLKKSLGADIVAGKHWLEMEYPYGPPLEYVRSGLEFGDGFIAWSQQHITDQEQHSLSRALWPTAVYAALKEASSTWFLITWKHVSQALGMPSSDNTPMEKQYSTLLGMLQKQKAQHQKRTLDAQTDPEGSTQLTSPSSATTSRKQSDEGLAGNSLWLLPKLSEANAERNAVRHLLTSHSFVDKLRKSWRPRNMEPPKGTLVVAGLLELRGQRGKLLLEVRACYDPKKCVYVNTDVLMRSFKVWKQRAKGGN